MRLRFPPTLSIKTRCAIIPAESTICLGRNFPTTSKIFRRTTWRPIRSSISAKFLLAERLQGRDRRLRSVLQNYPQSFKLAASLLKKGMAELEVGRSEQPAFGTFAPSKTAIPARTNRVAPTPNCARSAPPPRLRARPRADRQGLRILHPVAPAMPASGPAANCESVL